MIVLNRAQFTEIGILRYKNIKNFVLGPDFRFKCPLENQDYFWVGFKIFSKYV